VEVEDVETAPGQPRAEAGRRVGAVEVQRRGIDAQGRGGVQQRPYRGHGRAGEGDAAVAAQAFGQGQHVLAEPGRVAAVGEEAHARAREAVRSWDGWFPLAPRVPLAPAARSPAFAGNRFGSVVPAWPGVHARRG
jgi:hypothetical protein